MEAAEVAEANPGAAGDGDGDPNEEEAAAAAAAEGETLKDMGRTPVGGVL